jgi:hypothetical protein
VPIFYMEFVVNVLCLLLAGQVVCLMLAKLSASF